MPSPYNYLFYYRMYSIKVLPASFYPKNEISTPAATAEPITPEILLAIQY